MHSVGTEHGVCALMSTLVTYIHSVTVSTRYKLLSAVQIFIGLFVCLFVDLRIWGSLSLPATFPGTQWTCMHTHTRTQSFSLQSGQYLLLVGWCRFFSALEMSHIIPLPLLSNLDSWLPGVHSRIHLSSLLEKGCSHYTFRGAPSHVPKQHPQGCNWLHPQGVP